MAADGIVRGYQACQVEQQFQRGEVSDRERVVAHVKNGGGMACGWGVRRCPWLAGSGLGLGARSHRNRGRWLARRAGRLLRRREAAQVVVHHVPSVIYAGDATRDGAGWVGDRATHLWGEARHRLGW